MMLWLASCPKTPAFLLRITATSLSVKVREATAKHPNTPPDVLTRLLGDNMVWVNHAAAMNPNTPVVSNSLFDLAISCLAWFRNRPDEAPLIVIKALTEGDMPDRLRFGDHLIYGVGIPKMPHDVLQLIYNANELAIISHPEEMIMLRWAHRLGTMRKALSHPEFPVEDLGRIYERAPYDIIRAVVLEAIEQRGGLLALFGAD